jgi:hypothetical protein
MSDVGERADDYERKLASAPSTGAIINGLVKSVASTKRTIRLLAVSLVVDVVLSLIMVGIAAVAWTNAKGVEANTRNLCLNTSKLEISHNRLVDTLIVNVKTSSPKIFTPADKIARIKNYYASRVPAELCSKP